VAAEGAQAHTPLVSPTKRSSDQRSVDIMLSAATQSESVVLQRKLTGGSSAPSTPSLLETTLSRQMSSFKLDWQINPDEIEFCRDADGKLWQLGTGGYGHASAPPSRAPLQPAVSSTFPSAGWPDCWFEFQKHTTCDAIAPHTLSAMLLRPLRGTVAAGKLAGS